MRRGWGTAAGSRPGVSLALVIALLPWWPPPRATHDFHVTYGRMAIEGQVAVARIRFFRDDLETALAVFGSREDFRLTVDPRVDSLFLAYLSDRFQVTVDDRRLAGRVIGSGEDEIHHEPAWWYVVRFDADQPITGLAIRNTLLFEVHDDQKNMLKVVRFPDDVDQAYTFSHEEPSTTVVFPDPGP